MFPLSHDSIVFNLMKYHSRHDFSVMQNLHGITWYHLSSHNYANSVVYESSDTAYNIKLHQILVSIVFIYMTTIKNIIIMEILPTLATMDTTS